GYLLKRRQWLSDDFWRGAEKLNYYALFPVMLFLNLATAKIQMDVIEDVVLVVFSIMAVVSIALYIFRYIYQISYARLDRKSTRLNSSHVKISYAVFCLKKKKNRTTYR